MSGSANSPLLRSLKIDYENDSNNKVIMEKRVYNCRYQVMAIAVNSGDGRSVEKSTFEPGDVAAVSIKVNSSSQTPANFDLRDFLPEEAVAPIELTSAADRSRYCHLSPSNQVLTGMEDQSHNQYVQWQVDCI